MVDSQLSLPLATAERLDLPDGEVVLYRGCISSPEADDHLAGLEIETNWSQPKALVYNKESAVPRLSAWYGDFERTYTYSGIKMQPVYWTERLIELKDKVEQVSGGARFNSVLLNKYRDEYDGVSWHADDEPELGVDPVIGSLSLGASRRFQLRHRYRPGSPPSEILSIDLHHGDVLVMSGATQRNWLHQVPKKNRRPDADLANMSAGEQIAKKLLGTGKGVKPLPRISLTFRTITPTT